MIRPAKGQVQSEAMTRRTTRWGVYAWNLLMLVWLAFGLGFGSGLAPFTEDEYVAVVDATAALFALVLTTAAVGNVTLATLWLVSPER